MWTMFLSVLGSGCIRICPGQNTANVHLRSVHFITYKSDTDLKKRLLDIVHMRLNMMEMCFLM